MIEINLLPQEYRRKLRGRFDIDAGKIKKLSLSIVLILIGFSLVVQGAIVLNTLLLRRVDRVILKASPGIRQIVSLKRQIEKYTALENVLLDLSQRRIIMNKKLNIISDVITSGVWLNELTISEGSIEIKGSSATGKASEITQIDAFLSALNSRREIIADLGPIELNSVARRAYAGIEIVDFVMGSKKVSDNKDKKNQ